LYNQTVACKPGDGLFAFKNKQGTHYFVSLFKDIRHVRFRKYLFWDLPVKKLDLNRNQKLIPERVFTGGNIIVFGYSTDQDK